MSVVQEVLSIPKWFADKTILITGGLGFIGKVTIEKILRSTPEVRAIYIIIRSKRGLNALQRLEKFKKDSIFSVLKETNPDVLNKMLALEGDISQIGLGLSREDRKTIVNNVNIIYHMAASVRFDDSLTDAIFTNVRSTREVCMLALEMKNLDIFVHISTCYVNCDKIHSEEEVYPAYVDWKEAIRLAEELNRHSLDIVTLKYIDPFPNTYTFTKSLAEHVVKDLCNQKIPNVILRPSIIISTMDEPIKGWIDNFNGPVGLMVGAGKGIVKIVPGNADLTPDFMPVDILIKGFLVATWEKAYFNPKNNIETDVLNLNNNKRIFGLTNQMLCDYGIKLCRESPYANVISYPGCEYTLSSIYFYLMFYLNQLLPALLIDSLLKIAGQKPKLIKIQRKVFNTCYHTSYFLLNEFSFNNKKMIELEKKILECDENEFCYMYWVQGSILDIYSNVLEATKKYLFKETAKDAANAKVHLKRIKYLVVILQIIQYIGLALVLYFLVYALL